MKNVLLSLLILLAIAPPVLASGNLTVTASSISPSFINTNVTTGIINLTFNATVGSVNINLINITVVGMGTSNISFIGIRNDTASLGDNYTINSTTNQTSIFFPSGINVSLDSNVTISIVINLPPNASPLSTFSLNTSSTDIGLDGSNITSFSVQSSASQVQDVHANASVSPLFVDTSVINQTFTYSFSPVGRDSIFNMSIIIPTEYPIVNVTEVKQGSSILYNESQSIVHVSFNRTTGIINVTNTATGGFAVTGLIIVTMLINTSLFPVSAMTFNSTIHGSNLTDVSPYIYGLNSTVTTRQLIFINSVSAIKAAAMANGTDYWEFGISMNFTGNVSGLVQFKMANWSTNTGSAMSLVSNSTYYASLRDSENSSRIINLTNQYNSSLSLQTCCLTNRIYTLYLKMLIPAGAPSSSSWFTTYGILFRSS